MKATEELRKVPLGAVDPVDPTVMAAMAVELQHTTTISRNKMLRCGWVSLNQDFLRWNEVDGKSLGDQTPTAPATHGCPHSGGEGLSEGFLLIYSYDL